MNLGRPAVLLTAFLLAASCGAKDKKATAPPGLPVTAAAVEKKDVPLEAVAVGHVDAVLHGRGADSRGRRGDERRVPRRPGREAGRPAVRDRPPALPGRAGRGRGEPRAGSRPRPRGGREPEALRRARQEGLRHAGAVLPGEGERRRPEGDREGGRRRRRDGALERLVLPDHRADLGPDRRPPRALRQHHQGERRPRPRRHQPGRAHLRHVRVARIGPRGRQEACRGRRAEGERPAERAGPDGLRGHALLHRQHGGHDDRHDQPEGHVPEPRPRALARTVHERLAHARDRNERRRRAHAGGPDRATGLLRLRRQAGRDGRGPDRRRAPHLAAVVRDREGARTGREGRDRRAASPRARGEGRDQDRRRAGSPAPPEKKS